MAFANTEGGGTLLIGVDEIREKDEAQRGVILGCDVSDTAILQIVNKAVSCVPPVGIEIFIENISAKPILRLAVLDSPNKPHCTPKGNYCRRDGTRNRALHPTELLSIFLEREARVFTNRFEAAADRVARDIASLEKTLEASIESLGDKLGWAESRLGDTESTLDSIESYVRSILGEIRTVGGTSTDISTRMRTLFRQDERDDPVRTAHRKEWLERVVKQLEGDTALLDHILSGGELSFTLQGKAALELTEAEARDAFDEATKVAADKRLAAKYTTKVKAPSKANKDELEQFATLVESGGEVSEGLRQRMKRADALGFLTFESKIVGTAALKNPSNQYRNGTFAKAKSTAEPASHPFELGWIYLAESHRGHKRIFPLLSAIIDRADGQGIYATTRSSNEPMKKLLSQFGFTCNGTAYNSTQNPNEELMLFLRPTKKS